MKAIEDQSDASNFEETVRRLSKEDWQELLKQLPEDRVHNPKVFYKMAKLVSKLHKNTAIVKGFVEEGKDIPLEEGLLRRIKEIYCPKNTPNIGVRVAREF